MTEKIKVVVIGGSAGSFSVLSDILCLLRKDFNIPLFLCLHRLKNVSEGFEEALNIRSAIKVREPNDKEIIKKGRIYLAPANYHMLAEIGNTISLSVDAPYHFSRPSIDLTFDSFSYIYQKGMVCIILSGANADGAKGLQKAYQRGACTIVQDPEEAAVKTMVNSSLELFTPHHILRAAAIADFLNNLR